MKHLYRSLQLVNFLLAFLLISTGCKGITARQITSQSESAKGAGSDSGTDTGAIGDIGGTGDTGGTGNTGDKPGYHVAQSGNDSNAGSISLPFKTIHKGLSMLNAGDTLFIHSGTYNERIFEIDFGGSGSSWENPVTVAAYPGETVTLQTGGENTLRFQDGSISYVILDGFAVDGTDNPTGSSPIYFGPASHHLRFQNVESRNSPGNGMIGEGSFHEFINLKVHSNGWRSQVAGYGPGANGMYLAINNSVITGGSYYNNLCYGVRFGTSDAADSADNNIIQNAEVYGNGYGVAFSGASRCGSSGGGLVFADKNNLARNNLIYQNLIGITFLGLSGKMAYDLKAYNNTISNSVGSAIEIQTPVNNAELRGNILNSNGSDVRDGGTGTVIH